MSRGRGGFLPSAQTAPGKPGELLGNLPEFCRILKSILQNLLTKALSGGILHPMDKGVRTGSERFPPAGGPGAFSFFSPLSIAGEPFSSCVLERALSGKIGPGLPLGRPGKAGEFYAARRHRWPAHPLWCAVSAIFSKRASGEMERTSSGPSP